MQKTARKNESNDALRTNPQSPIDGRISSTRDGKILVLLAILLPVLIGSLGLVLDSGLLMADYRNLQHAADAAATAAAMDMFNGESEATAISTAVEYVHVHNGFADANVSVNVPPTEGRYVGNSNYVEVIIEHVSNTYFIQVLGTENQQMIRTRSIAGFGDSTAGAAVVVLDPDPPGISVDGSIPLPTSVPPLQLGGLELLGAGQLNVDGAVLVNNEWGGVDQDGNPAGADEGPPYAVACTPILPLTRLLARDIRVVGGVDNPENYGHFEDGEPSPLQAGKLPVPDPFRSLPVPITSSDPANVLVDEYGGVEIATLPLIDPTTTLTPGVYEWIKIDSGNVVFTPGVYIIRNVNPDTQIALDIKGGTVTANGVMFYITDSVSYSAESGGPDSSDGETAPSAPSATTLVPSVVINAGLLGSRFTPLNDAGSPFNGLLIYQRRADRRPLVLVSEQLSGNGSLEGTVYAKWSQVIFSANGDYDMRFVAGSLRFVDVLNCTIAPTELLPPAQDVFLVE